VKDSSPVVLITGSTRGLGKILADRYSQEGYNVVTNSRSQCELSTARQNITHIPGDVECHEEAKYLVNKLGSQFGRLDTLICNVGSGRSVQAGRESYDEWVRMFSINFFSATNVIEPSVELLRMSENPSIICISSICGIETIQGAPVTYSVAKAALNAYIKFISRAYAEVGVRINGIAPGNILAKGSIWETMLLSDPSSTLEYIQKEVPLNTFCNPDSIAEIAIFLSSVAGRYCTGSIYTIDAGQTRSF